MSSVQAYNSVSFGKLFLAFSLILLIALFFISMQTSFKNTEEFGKKLEIDMASKLDDIFSAVSIRGYIWNAFSKIIETARRDGIESEALADCISDCVNTKKIKGKFFFYRNNNYIKSFYSDSNDLELFQKMLIRLSYTSEDKEYTEANRTPHKRLLELFGTGNRLELVKLTKGQLASFWDKESNQYYYWQNFQDGLGVFFYTNSLPSLTARFEFVRKTDNYKSFGVIDSLNKDIFPPMGLSDDQTLLAYLKSTKSNNSFVLSNEHYWYFQTNRNNEKMCYTIPLSETAEMFFDWAGLVEKITVILFVSVLILYFTSLLNLFPGKSIIIFLDNTSIRYRVMGIFAMASFFPVIMAFIIGTSVLSDKQTVIEKAIFTESLAGINDLENQINVVLENTELMAKDLREAIKYEKPTVELFYKYLDKYAISHDLTRLDVRDSEIKTIFSMDDREIHSVAEIMDLISRLVLKLHNPERLNSRSLQISPAELVSESVLSTDQIGLATLIRQRNKQWFFKVGHFPTTWYWDIYPDLASGPAFLCVTTQLITTFSKQIEDYLSVSHVASDSLQLYTQMSVPYFFHKIRPDYANLPEEQLLNIANMAFETNKVVFRTINFNDKPYWVTAKHETNVSSHIFLHLISQEDRLKVLEPFKLQLVCCGIFALFISLLGAWYITNLIILPVGDLTDGISAIRKRIKGFSIPVRREDEFGKLAVAFNEVIDDLEELEYGKFIQESLLPAMPIEVEGFDIAYFHLSATDLAGDYHDDAKLDDGRSVIILGDVSGHGISASLVMAMAKATFNYAKSKKVQFPEEALDMLNTMLNKETKSRNKLMTLISAVINPETSEVIFDNGGQSYPCYYTAETQQCEEIVMPSLPLGGMKKRKHKAITKVMKPGDAFIFYTDGIIECSAENGEMFGYERFYKLFTDLMKNNKRASEALAVLHQSFEDFREQGPRADDVTMIIVKKL